MVDVPFKGGSILDTWKEIGVWIKLIKLSYF